MPESSSLSVRYFWFIVITGMGPAQHRFTRQVLGNCAGPMAAPLNPYDHPVGQCHPVSHGNKVRCRGHILRMFWNEHALVASEAKQRRRNKANGGRGVRAEGGPVRAEGTLGHSDAPEEDAACVLDSPLGDCRPLGGSPGPGSAPFLCL